jgi:hypothetical protein
MLHEISQSVSQSVSQLGNTNTNRLLLPFTAKSLPFLLKSKKRTERERERQTKIKTRS